MPSASLCVRVVFKGSRPDFDWLDSQSVLFWLGGRWLNDYADGYTFEESNGIWIARWLSEGPIVGCAGQAAITNEQRQLRALTEKNLLAVAASIEAAWERENAPEPQCGAGCPLCAYIIATRRGSELTAADVITAVEAHRIAAKECQNAPAVVAVDP